MRDPLLVNPESASEHDVATFKVRKGRDYIVPRDIAIVREAKNYL